ncbi:Capsule synthesis protein, CapA [Geodermatophilus obscurus DSM 43160]|uniref:Capsule synthesis protein, CapA n=1 Tax=Geodermatophilus obscurus (strain ATCC 25078 / DSM 43160 / JCM 3152 / CCUG 61914 / KCC A-0152 / KCTC 9177 / NBRC 13315 / NRRL B-3577 / G-20) TaxID=526225 RepID=D2S5I1_GEOOG|nr:Capsule synthesis protein, CapA [Geodermatophilus obscurus DSM 43160]
MASGPRIRTLSAVLAGLGLAVLTGCSPAEPAGRGAATATTATPTAPASFTVAATGDVLIHQGGALVQGAAAAGQAQGVGYDFSGVFADVAPVIGAADLAICHLETPLAPPEGPFEGYPTFAVQPQIVGALAGAGYDTCSTASNHSLDAGFAGLVRTLDTLDAHRVGHTGTYRTEPEAQIPHLVTVDGVRVAHLSWTYGLNGIPQPAGQPWAVNDFDPAGPRVEGILAEAARARAAGAEVVIASVHCCTEYDPDPSPAQTAIAEALLASPDIDLMLGHHAHVVQPFERIHGEWVAYGLGNHIAQQTRPVTYDSVIARFTFTRGPEGRYTVSTAEAIPTHIRLAGDGLAVVPTHPGEPAYERVAEVVGRRGGADAGLLVSDR